MTTDPGTALPPLRRPTRYRVIVSIGLVLGHAGVALNYLLRPASSLNPTANVVARLDELGPVWFVVFGVSALAVALSLITKWGVVAAHALALGVTTGYSFALYFTAAAAGTGWATASMSLVAIAAALSVTASYQADQG